MFIVKDFLHWLSQYRLKLIVLFAAAVWGVVWVWPRSAGLWPRSAGWPDSKLTLVFCSVGQGDASILSRGFTQVLIDSGPANPKTADCLGRRLPFFDHRLEAVIISHPQTDHFGGLPEVLKRYQVDKFIFNGFAGDSRAWARLSQLVEAEKSQVVTLAAGDKLKVGEIEIDVLWPLSSSDASGGGEARIVSRQTSGVADGGRQPPHDTGIANPTTSPSILGISSSRDLNADALVLALSYGDFSALFTGDIGEKEEKLLISRQASGGGEARIVSRQTSGVADDKRRPPHETGLATATDLPITILKVAHHGSKTSSSAGFLNAVRPKLAVIEVGKNSYGHPADEVLKRLEGIGARVLRTDRDGDVVVETDGKRWEVKTN